MNTKYTYKTSGTCCKEINITIDDFGVMRDIVFKGGCPGNLNAIKTMLEGKPYTDYLHLFSKNACGNKPTSCMMEFDKFLNQIHADRTNVLEYPNKEVA